MATFKIVEHVIPGQHIREYYHSVKGRQEAPVQLAIKQYIPLDRPEPIPDNAVTIIGTHGNGSPKVSYAINTAITGCGGELFEPFWQRLSIQLQKQGVPLRAIWIADIANQGASGILNEDIRGDPNHWHDHSRDLLHMVNHFRDEIPRPVIGVGHSMGCAQLVHLSILHPRLLSSLLLYEPVILGDNTIKTSPAGFIARRKDLWKSREEAEAYLRKRLTWHPEVVDRYIQFGLRSTPSRLYNSETAPNLSTSAVTLSTTRYQEAMGYAIPNLEPEASGLDPWLLPGWSDKQRDDIIGRPEAWVAMELLPFVRPSVFWVFGTKSYLSWPESQDEKMQKTGTGVGGSGGAKRGMVEKAVLEGASHNVILEDLDWSADVGSEWVKRWFKNWLADEQKLAGYQSKISDSVTGKASEASLSAWSQTGQTGRPKL
ncbi:toxin biosynthesis protein [Penicillium angulare]|uniref:Toxin biosynthesis protein n=1 Tax=Penicillium angulare TaxID=116970 RepID=A0A9W9F4L1_9EURO|nr:toxin biosynthesis protein [Penicillium angulare]